MSVRIVEVLHEPGSVSLGPNGAIIVRDALLIGLAAIGEQLKNGAELKRGDEISVLSDALQIMQLDDDGKAIP